MCNENAETSNWYWTRACEFVRNSDVINQSRSEGWLSSSCLLQGYAAELLAKAILLQEGRTVRELSRQPFSHNIEYMWKEKTGLFFEAEADAKRKLASKEIPVTFDFPLHFKTLAEAHGSSSNYSLRYNQGVRIFSDPVAMCNILSGLVLKYGMQQK